MNTVSGMRAARRASSVTLAVIAASLFGAGGAFAAGIAATVKNNGQSHACTLESMSTTGSAATILLSGCDLGANTGGGSSGDTGGGDAGGSTPGDDTGGGNAGGGNSGGGSTSPVGDPGTGLWQPEGMPNVFVLDQSGPANQVVGSSIAPGCLNGGSLDYNAACRPQKTFADKASGKSVNLTQGKIISVRYKVDASAAVSPSTGFFRLSNIQGSNIVYRTTMSLSATPGDFSNSRCMVTETRRPTLNTGSSYCNIDRTQKLYYLNIRVEVPCTECVFVISESSSQLK